MPDRPEESQPSSDAAGGWFVPKRAMPQPENAAPQQGTPENDVPMPGETPQRTGGWYVPSDAKDRAAAVSQQSAAPDQPAQSSPPQSVAYDEFGMPVLPGQSVQAAAAAPSAPQKPAKPAAAQAPQSVTENELGMPVYTDQPVDSSAPTPAASDQPAETQAGAQQESLPAGAAVVSDQIDYSNYVPGKGFVASGATNPAAPAADAAPTGVQGAAAPAEQPLEPAPEVSLQDAASVYTPTGDSSAQVAEPLAEGTPADNDAAAAEAESAAMSGSQPADSGKPVSPELIHRYEDVEKSVHALRRKYNSGMITRGQLQDDLRKLMILDQDGFWWMIGMESDRWYKYNGKDWIQAIRPGKTAEDESSKAATPPDVAPAADQVGGVTQASSAVAVDEPGLPQRVPISDMGATMVGPSAPKLDNTLRVPSTSSRAGASAGSSGTPRYLERASQVRGSAFDGGLTLPSGGAQLTQPNRPVAPGTAFPGPYRPTQAGDMTVAGAAVQPVAIPAAGTSPRLQAGEQPEYPEPPSGFLADRQRAAGCIIQLAIGGLFLGLIAALVGIGILVAGYFSIVGQYDTNITNLGAHVQAAAQSTRILDVNGRLLVQLNNPNTGSRTYVPLAKIQPYMLAATIRTEDQRFYDTPGFDVVGIIRAILQNLRAGTGVSGASGITQQLARTLVLDPGAASDRSAQRKIVEIVVSSEIARRYSKDQLLEYYLNTVYYGNLAYGVQAAAQTYFGIGASDLNLAQAAFLAGLVQAPATYDPITNRGATMGRFDEVLTLLNQGICIPLQSQGTFCVGKQDVDAATVLVAKVKAQTFKPPTNNAIYPHFVNYVQQLLEQQFGKDAVYSSGFTVYTTIDPKVQDVADAAVKQQIATLKNYHVTNGAVLAVRPSDGAILAMVGSADFNNKDIDGQFNVTLAPRQPGSSIKPFVYLTSFERDANNNYFTPATILWDVPSCFGGTPAYCPPNYDGKFHGPITIRLALDNSINVAAVKTLQYDTIDRFKAFAQRVGLEFLQTQPEQAGLGSALGGVEVPMIDMAQGYAVLANGGKKVDLYAITKVTKGDTVVFEAKDHPAQQVVEPGLDYLMTNILADNQARQMEFGNGLTLPDGRPAAVKTGTTNDFKDNWTIGYTPQLVVAVWVGNSDNTSMIGTTGLTGAAPIWKQVMTNALSGQPKLQFDPPSTVQQMTVCADFGTQDFPDCPTRHTEIFFGPNPPPPATNIFQKLTIDTFSGLIANNNCPDFQDPETFLTVTDPTAISWLNNDPNGQAWAKTHNLTLPVVPPPTQACDPNTPRPILTLTSPQPNMQVQGNLEVRGSVSLPGFNRYQIEAGTGANATQFQIVAGPFGSQPTADNSFLGGWDTTNLPNGPYTLRLWAVDGQGRHAQRIVNLFIANGVPGIGVPATPSGGVAGGIPTVTPQNFGQPVPATPTPIVINPQGPTQAPTLVMTATSAPALPPTNTLRPIFPPTSTP